MLTEYAEYYTNLAAWVAYRKKSLFQRVAIRLSCLFRHDWIYQKQDMFTLYGPNRMCRRCYKSERLGR